MLDHALRRGIAVRYIEYDRRQRSPLHRLMKTVHLLDHLAWISRATRVKQTIAERTRRAPGVHPPHDFANGLAGDPGASAIVADQPTPTPSLRFTPVGGATVSGGSSAGDEGNPLLEVRGRENQSRVMHHAYPAARQQMSQELFEPQARSGHLRSRRTCAADRRTGRSELGEQLRQALGDDARWQSGDVGARPCGLHEDAAVLPQTSAARGAADVQA
jgi:hypothetical protein